MIDVNLIDIEASGLGLDSYPIEIAILINKKMFSWLIAPEKSWRHWDAAAENLHGISREILISQGKAARLVAEAINEAMVGTNGLLYSDAAEWDVDWIRTLFSAVGAIPEFHILPVSDLFTDTEFRRFQCKYDEIAGSGKYRRHRAEPDIWMIHEALCSAFQADT